MKTRKQEYHHPCSVRQPGICEDRKVERRREKGDRWACKISEQMTKVYSGLSSADLEEEVKGKRIETISQQPQREDSREISSLETTACLPVLLPVLLEYASIGIALHIFFKSYYQTCG